MDSPAFELEMENLALRERSRLIDLAVYAIRLEKLYNDAYPDVGMGFCPADMLLEEVETGAGFTFTEQERAEILKKYELGV